MRRFNTLKKIIPVTLPVFAGYLAIGIAFGLMLSEKGYGLIWATAMSILMFAGSGQYLGVGLLAAGASLPEVAMMQLILNFRHLFYSVSILDRYKNVNPLRKWYLYFGLTDETYAILSTAKVPEDVSEDDYYFYVTLFDHFYWILGSMIGSVFGKVLTISLEGVDFAMTALFVVLFVEQYKSSKEHRPAIIGFIITIISLVILGPSNFLIPALIVITALLFAFRKTLEGDNKERG